MSDPVRAALAELANAIQSSGVAAHFDGDERLQAAYNAARAAAPAQAERAAAQKPVAWATPSLLVTLSAVEKNHLTNPDRRTRGGEFESAAADAERYSVPLYAAPPAQAEPQEGDLLHTMMEWARTEEGRKQLADSYRPHLWACAKRVADPQNEAATCRHWCGDIEHCQPIASAPAQPEPRTIPAHVQPATLSPPTDWDDAQPEPAEDDDARLIANLRAESRYWTDEGEHEALANGLANAADRLAALREERDALHTDAMLYRDSRDRYARQLDEARAALAEAQADAERWIALCNLWMASTILTLTQDEDGRWSIGQTEPVDSETFATLTGDTPDAAIDAARKGTP